MGQRIIRVFHGGTNRLRDPAEPVLSFRALFFGNRHSRVSAKNRNPAFFVALLPLLPFRSGKEKKMKKAECSRKVYDRGTGEWFSVTEEQYAEYDRWRVTLRKREQRHGCCRCPRDKWWLCDGICDACEFHCCDEMLSLDEFFTEGEGEGQCLLECLCSDSPSMEEQFADRDLVEKLLQLLREMDPDADKIIALWEEDFRISDRKIAEKLGRLPRTFSYQMQRYREVAKKFWKNEKFFCSKSELLSIGKVEGQKRYPSGKESEENDNCKSKIHHRRLCRDQLRGCSRRQVCCITC